MIVIPAIDLRRGRCVRLHQGRSDRETVFKAFARALRMALQIDARAADVIPSTKGSL